jgi:phosphatidylserine/phosphatidylglycerophosphate/cardiolipin synthase-like enzyme
MKKSNLTVLGVYFSPQGGCEGQVVNWIDRANKTIHVVIYSFTNDAIGDAVVRAHQRGVEIKVVFEKKQVSEYSEYWKLQNIGALVKNDTNSGLMHHKTAIIDGYILLTGSFNWSGAAEERNNENLMILESDYLTIAFIEEFQQIWDS